MFEIRRRTRYGRNVTENGCWLYQPGQAHHRAGLWLIKTELLETQTVDFSVGAGRGFAMYRGCH
ncbi:hypothetical protein [Escherichia coli]|uniref:hypothetical protein n=1 Tax=Escherichia coli TaxID=562 RepID=UPI0040446BF6